MSLQQKNQILLQQTEIITNFINNLDIKTPKGQYIKVLNSLQQLCTSKAKIQFSVQGTKICCFCKQFFKKSESQKSTIKQIEVTSPHCKHSYHKDCLKKQIQKITKEFDEQQIQNNLKCQQCNKNIPYTLVEAVFSQQEIFKLRTEVQESKILECPICCDEKNIMKDCVTLNCGHQLCKICFRGEIDNNIKSGKVTSNQMQCPICDDNEKEEFDVFGIYKKSEINPQMILQYCSPELQSSYYNQTLKKGGIIMCPGKLKKPQNIGEQPEKLDLIVQLQILNNKMPEGIETMDCTFVIGKDVAKSQKKIYCPVCNLNFCALCQDQGHLGTCEEFRQEKIRLQELAKQNELKQQKDIEDEAAMKFYMEQNDIRICPNPECRSLIQKNGGCNRVTCGKCDKSMCWKDKCMQLFDTHEECYAHLDEVHGGYFDEDYDFNNDF